MCGRYVIRKPVTSTNKIVHKNEGVDDSENFNAYPTSLLPIIKADENEIILTFFSESGFKLKDRIHEISKAYFLPIDSYENAKKLVEVFKETVMVNLHFLL